MCGISQAIVWKTTNHMKSQAHIYTVLLQSDHVCNYIFWGVLLLQVLYEGAYRWRVCAIISAQCQPASVMCFQTWFNVVSMHCVQFTWHFRGRNVGTSLPTMFDFGWLPRTSTHQVSVENVFAELVVHTQYLSKRQMVALSGKGHYEQSLTTSYGWKSVTEVTVHWKEGRKPWVSDCGELWQWLSWSRAFWIATVNEKGPYHA